MGPRLSWLGRAPCQSRPCQQCLWELGPQGGSGVCVGWGGVPRHLAEVWDLQLPCPGYLSVLVTGAAKTRSLTQALPSAGPSRPVLHLNLTVSWRRTGRGGAALWAGMSSVAHSFQLLASGPAPNTVCLGGREAGTLGPYLGSWLGSGWVLSRAQELKRSLWGRVWGGLGSGSS